jgi:hypothetical protein
MAPAGLQMGHDNAEVDVTHSDHAVQDPLPLQAVGAAVMTERHEVYPVVTGQAAGNG